MEIFLGAGLLSILQSILFWNQRIGISGLIFTIAIIFITYKLLKERAKNPKALIISIPIILLSSTYFIFNNELFRKLNLFVIPILYVIMIIFTTSEIELKSIIHKIILMVLDPLNDFGEVIAQIKEKLKIKSVEKKKTNRGDIIKAIVITGIISCIVLGLLISADSEFARIFAKILKWFIGISVPTLVIRILLIIFFFFYISSFFINMLSKDNVLKECDNKREETKESLTIRMILIALNILYFVFCIIEVKGFITTENIIYSQYARKGFFQLMIVSLINLVVILKATNKNLEETEKQKSLKKKMCIIMIIFTFIIILFSFTRMIMYQNQYGDTRLRILVDFTLITEIILLVPTIMYITKEKINLAKSYFIIILTMYCVVNFANIDYIIAKNNVDRFIKTGDIDYSYLTQDINSTDIIGQLIRLKETNFEGYVRETDSQNIDYKELYNKWLDEYLTNKSKNLDNTERTIAESNLSEWIAKFRLNKAGY